MRSVFVSLLLLLLLACSASAATTPGPVILSLNPTSAVVGTGALDLTVTGANFQSGASVKLDGVSRATTFVDASHLTAHLSSADLLSARTYSVTVTNPGIVTSGAVSFEVLPNEPAIVSIDPATVVAGGSNLTLTVEGSNFASSAVVRVNNVNRQTTYVSSSRLSAVVTASDISSARTLSITVLNPSNKISNAVTLTVSANAVPTITLFSPATVKAGSKAFTLTITGNNFASGAIVKIGSRSFKTTFIDSQHLTIPLLASDVATAGSLSFTVTNPNNVTSQPVALPITSSTLPVIETLNPNSALAGAQGFTLTVTGQNFVSGMTLSFNGVSRTTKVTDAQHLTATIQRTEIATPGQVAVTVTTAGSSGETSLPISFNIVSAKAAVITAISPATVPAGAAAFKLLVNGSGFVQGDVVQLSGDPHATEFISVTQLAVTIPATDLTTAGEFEVTVLHPTGELSAPALLAITDAASPIVDALSPQSANVGDTPFTLTVMGSNFSSQSIVTFDDVPRQTSFVDSTRLTVTMTEADLANARTFNVAVRNAGGAVSNVVQFVVGLQVPSIAQLSPSSAIAGDAGFTLALTGSNFGSNAIVNVNGTARATAFEPATGRVTVVLTASDLASAGTLNITISDHGVTSPVVKLTVARPTIVAYTPLSIRAGEMSAVVTVTASAFLTTSKLLVRGEERETVSDPSAGTLTTTLTAGDLANPGAIAINVRNGALATSPAVFINITADAPRVDSVTPSPIAAGNALLRLHVFGANFLTGTQIQVNGETRATTYVSGTELIVDLRASDVANAGTLRINAIHLDGTMSNDLPLQVVAMPGSAPSRRRAAGH